MGTETSLYGKPRAYARFLGAELNYVYNDRLLVVMPGGFGFNDPRHPLAPTYAALRPITIKPGTIGLLNAAQSAVHELAAKNGVRLSAPPPVAAPEGNTTRTVSLSPRSRSSGFCSLSSSSSSFGGARHESTRAADYRPGQRGRIKVKNPVYGRRESEIAAGCSSAGAGSGRNSPTQSGQKSTTHSGPSSSWARCPSQPRASTSESQPHSSQTSTWVRSVSSSSSTRRVIRRGRPAATSGRNRGGPVVGVRTVDGARSRRGFAPGFLVRARAGAPGRMRRRAFRPAVSQSAPTLTRWTATRAFLITVCGP